MADAIVDLISRGQWRITVWSWRSRRCWTYRRLWGWLPGRSTVWSGKIIHYRWGPFELVHDKRGGPLAVLSDLTGVPQGELRERLHKETPNVE